MAAAASATATLYTRFAHARVFNTGYNNVTTILMQVNKHARRLSLCGIWRASDFCVNVSGEPLSLQINMNLQMGARQLQHPLFLSISLSLMFNLFRFFPSLYRIGCF